MRLIFLAVKFSLLAVIYLFIMRVFYFILTDLRRTSDKTPQSQTGTSRQAGSGAELVVTESRDPSVEPGRIIPLGEKTSLGRDRHNDVRFSDTFVSHDHAQIILNQDNYYIEDLESINGTYINGEKAAGPVSLAHGDTIKMAGVTFKFVRWEYEVE